MGLPVCLLLSFAWASDLDVSCMTTIAHRMWDVPNPYESLPALLPGSPLGPEPPPMAEPARGPHPFVIEDSADMMGLPLSRNVLVGFQVEFTGPGDEPSGTAKTSRVARDPYDYRFLLPTTGLRIKF